MRKVIKQISLVRTQVREMSFPYNDSSNGVHPIINIVSKKHGNEANDVGDDIKEVVLCICFDNLVGERTAVNS